MNQAVGTVSDVVNRIKNLLEGQFRTISVEGEITNLSSSSSGHWYFNLSDRNSSISCALFKMDALRNPMVRKLRDGDKVICSGGIGVYGKRGTFQLITKRITPVGKGDLKEELEKLKKKLAAEGLFDLEAKVKIPELPKRVAVITAEGAAAYQDFLNIYKRRSQWMDIILSPALVQGDAAPGSIRKALSKVIKYHLEASDDKKFDCVVLTRGGGSLEDLWAFNDEALAWDIFNCPIPVISAVGHQVDYSISDFVADLRCETPSAAAEVLTQSQSEIIERLRVNKKRLSHQIQSVLHIKKASLSVNHPRNILEIIRNRLTSFQRRLGELNITHRLDEFTRFSESQYRLDDSLSRLKRSMGERISQTNSRLDKAIGILGVLDPKNVLGRGYSFITNDKNKLIGNVKDFSSLPKDSELQINFHDGKGKVVKQ